ncbi:serine/threonine protein phosphatase PrpC [Streptacidiphilus sp. EB103A]
MDQLTLSCPNCAQPVGESDRFCEQCGSDLTIAAGGPSGAAAPSGAAHAYGVAPAGTGPGVPSGPGAPPGQAAYGGIAPAAGGPGGTGAGAVHGGADTGRSGFAGAGASPAAGGSGGARAAAEAVGVSQGGFAGPEFPAGQAAHSEAGAPAPAGAPGEVGVVPPRPVGPPVVGVDPRAGLGRGGAETPQPGQVAGATGDFLLAAPAQLLVSEEEPEAELDHAPTEPNPVVVIAPGSGPVCVGCGEQRIDADGYCEACGRAQPRPRDHQERALAGVTGVSDRGHRHHRNEDAFAVAATSRPGGSPAVVAVVCDGVSSATRPDEASQAAADTASEYLLESLESGADPKSAMHAAIMAAAQRVEDLASEGPLEPSRNSPACTIVGAIAADGEVTVGWVGDSRAYWFPDERAGSERLTVDDSWAARMVEAGLMEEAEAYADARAHAITGWLGADAVEVEPHTTVFAPPAAGVVLICTDGLWNYWESAADLGAVVPADARTRPLEAAQELVRFACERGGHDNITVAVLPCLPSPLSAPYTPTELSLPVMGAGEKREI